MVAITKLIPLSFTSGAGGGAPLRQTTQIYIPFQPEEIRLVELYGSTSAGDAAAVGSGWLYSDLFIKNGQFDGFVGSVDLNQTDDISTMRRGNHIVFGLDKPDVTQSYVFELRNFDGTVKAPGGANITFTGGVVLEFVA